MMSSSLRARTKDFTRRLVQKHCIAIYLLTIIAVVVYNTVPVMHTVNGQIWILLAYAASAGFVAYHACWWPSKK